MNIRKSFQKLVQQQLERRGLRMENANQRYPQLGSNPFDTALDSQERAARRSRSDFEDNRKGLGWHPDGDNDD